jgi:hypothetical protein
MAAIARAVTGRDGEDAWTLELEPAAAGIARAAA